MALRLRRGTDAERQTITPLEGELIYTTDTEKLFIGDGTTLGGNPYGKELSDLIDVNTTGVSDGETLVYNLANTRFEPGTLATAINDLTDVDTTGIVLNSILKWNGTNFVPALEGGITEGATYNINVDGDLTGSVFGDDSTLLLDGTNNVYTGNVLTNRFRISNPNQPGDGLNGGAGEVNIDVFSNDNRSLLNLRRVSETDLSQDQSAIYGTVTFGREDINGLLTTNIFFGREHGMYFGNTPTGTFNDPTMFMVWRDNKLGVGKTDPAEVLDVNGNAAIDGFVQFGSLTTTERDALTAANGMVIYNTTDNKFQGYENGAWVNLIA